jgi:hypothetical protein
MTRQEWIDGDNLFYHITPTRNLESIFKKGILKGKDNPFGICVTRSSDSLIIEFICEMMLVREEAKEFSIIKISPRKINLRKHELLNDNVVEITNPLHNYIYRKSIRVKKEDVVGEFTRSQFGMQDMREFENRIRESNLLESLEL